jgi:hypothetical protein
MVMPLQRAVDVEEDDFGLNLYVVGAALILQRRLVRHHNDPDTHPSNGETMDKCFRLWNVIRRASISGPDLA